MEPSRQQQGTNANPHDRFMVYGLEPLFSPRSIAVVDGVGEPGSVADSIWKSISATYSRGELSRISAHGEDLEQVDELHGSPFTTLWGAAPYTHARSVYGSCMKESR